MFEATPTLKMSEILSTDFPIYSIGSVNDEVLYVAGGGGKSKTGIPNTIELFKLSSLNGGYTAVSLHKHDMGSDLVMQSEIYNETIAASVGKDCHVYEIKCSNKANSDTENAEAEDVVDNETDSVSLRNDKVEHVQEVKREDGVEPVEAVSGHYEITKSACVSTDEAVKDSCQNVVRFAKSGSRVVTAGEDGKIRIWSLPVLKPREALEGHQREVTDLVVHPLNEMCVSVSRDCTCRVWDLEGYGEVASFKWMKQSDYRFRSCCFSEDGENLFTINLPVKLSSKNRKKCYVTKWNVADWKELKSVAMNADEVLTTIASRSSYVAVGNISGDVTVLTTALKPVLKSIKAHTSFVTGLCFVPGRNKNCPQLLLSTSVDKKCCVTVLNKKGNSTSRSVHLVVIATVLLVIIAILTQFFM